MRATQERSILRGLCPYCKLTLRMEMSMKIEYCMPCGVQFLYHIGTAHWTEHPRPGSTNQLVEYLEIKAKYG